MSMFIRISVAVLLVSLSADPASPQDDEKFMPLRLMGPMDPITEFPIVPAADIDTQISGGELVIGVEINGEARAYPVNMLTGPRREIINDTLGGRAIAATW